VDRHVEAGRGDRVAFHWAGGEGEERAITYADLHRDVRRLANALKELGVQKGDVVGIYLPMIPEVVVAMLACARIGAPHNVVFGGFAPEAVKQRMEVSSTYSSSMRRLRRSRSPSSGSSESQSSASIRMAARSRSSSDRGEWRPDPRDPSTTQSQTSRQDASQHGSCSSCSATDLRESGLSQREPGGGASGYAMDGASREGGGTT
jgi:AMP-binding enzyme